MKKSNAELLDEIRRLIQPQKELGDWLKSSEVIEILKCSPARLQTLRMNGTLPFTKIGGTLYYARQDVFSLFHNKQS